MLVKGKGLYGLNEPDDVLDAGNSGTTIRLLSGLCLPDNRFTVLTGDDSLRRRPMARIITPLSQMGRVDGTEKSRCARVLRLKEPVVCRRWNADAGSQCPSQIGADVCRSLRRLCEQRISEPYLSRDHTERMFAQFGIPVQRQGLAVIVKPVSSLKAPSIVEVPGDFSSAAFLLAATIIPDSELSP